MMSGSSGEKRNGCPSSSSSSPESRLRETLKNLKEIVNCTEQEIYAMLKECNMDPNEAVQRLLTQDTFHEVKSKREKKREAKGTSAFWSNRVSISSSGRRVRGDTERSGHQTNSFDSDATHAKAVHKKENGASIRPTSSIMGFGAAANNSQVNNSDGVGVAVQAPALSVRVLSTSQPSSTLYHISVGARGQLSMADIVKMGRPQQKSSNSRVLPVEVHNPLHGASPPNTSQSSVRCTSANIPLVANQYLSSSQDNLIKVENTSHEPTVEVSQPQSLDEWTLVDHSDEESQAQLVASVSSANDADSPLSSSLHVDSTYMHISPHAENIQRLEGLIEGENLAPDSVISEGKERVNSSSFLEDGSFRNSGFYLQHKAEDASEELSLTASNLNHLNLQKEEQGVSLSECHPAVIIPDHLQVTNADFPHLSFGSFGSGLGASTSGTLLTKFTQRNLETASVTENALSVHSDTSNPENFNSGQLRTAPDDSAFSVTGADTRNYDAATSQPDVVGENPFIADQAVQYDIPSVSELAIASTSQSTDAVYNHAQSNFSMQNSSPLSNLMQPYTDSVSSTLMSGNAQLHRETGGPLLHLLANQSVPTKYSPAISSSSGSTISMSEALDSGFLSTLQSNLQTTPSTSISTAPTLPARLSLPAYSQPTLPVGSLTNMVSYPFLPHNVSYMPFSGSNAFHQSPAALQSACMRYAVPPFKSRISSNGLPQSLSVGSGHGGLGSSTSFPGPFLQNASSTPVGSSIGYEEALRSQYKETVSLHQGGNSSRPHGSGSRTMPSAAASTYYGLQDQSQQGSRIHRQAQHSQQMGMGMVGYPNYYNSQLGGISREHQQLISHRGSLNSSEGSGQGHPSHQSHQLWQQGY